MKTGCFDAVVSFTPADKDKPLDALILIRGTKIHASFYLYNTEAEAKTFVEEVKKIIQLA